MEELTEFATKALFIWEAEADALNEHVENNSASVVIAEHLGRTEMAKEIYYKLKGVLDHGTE